MAISLGQSQSFGIGGASLWFTHWETDLIGWAVPLFGLLASVRRYAIAKIIATILAWFTGYVAVLSHYHRCLNYYFYYAHPWFSHV